jgi:UDP-2,3-diacylglucosamine hydrolase
MNPAVPQTAVRTVKPADPVLQAPPHWRRVDFISDLHLQRSETATFGAWQDYMQRTSADAVFILGDLFEVWVGDDILGANKMASTPDQTPVFEVLCADILKAASQRLNLFFLHGNRDFLLGSAYANVCRMTLLDDPSVLAFAGQRWLLSHGDALCLDDTNYMQFRAQVRTLSWQQEFLAKPLVERQAMARALRSQSETRKHSGFPYLDVNTLAACDWLRAAHATTLIHGHTHRPADLDLPEGLRRIVLSDWDLGAKPARAEILRLSLSSPLQGAGCTIQRLPLAQAA